MKISLNWIKEFVEVPVDAKTLKADLKALGLGAETLTAIGDDWILDLEITANRPDCLSHYGVAREIATRYGKPLKPYQPVVKEISTPTSSAISIEISAPDLCARYCGRVVKNVKVKPSPDWLVRRLEALGHRSINNVADVTNYVMLEMGKALHAFDLARVRDRKITVRRARPGEHLKTLDSMDRTLTADNLAIADGKLPIALAGVMGGVESEISEATEDVLLESAWFEPASIRRTSKSFGLHTEASHRFERGADIDAAPVSLDRAAELIAELAGGEVLAGVVDIYPRHYGPPQLHLRPSEIRRILGADIEADKVKTILRALGCLVEKVDDESWCVTPPPWRLDLTREVDLTEEIARVVGYDHLPMRVRSAPPSLSSDGMREKELLVSEILVASGYRQIIANSMVDPTEAARFTDKSPVILQNPLSQEASAMRSTPVPGMLRALRWNLDRGRDDLRLYEMGKTYAEVRNPATGLPEEVRVLTLGLCGDRLPTPLVEQPRVVDFFDLKGDLENLLVGFEIPDLKYVNSSAAFFEAGQSGALLGGAIRLVDFGKISDEIGRDYKLRETVWVAVVDIEQLFAHSRRVLQYSAFSKFPAVERDFSLLIPEAVAFERIESAVRSLGLDGIRSFQPVDRMAVGKIAAGAYSLLLRVTFQSRTRTLTSEEIEALSRQVVGALEALGIRLRS